MKRTIYCSYQYSIVKDDDGLVRHNDMSGGRKQAATNLTNVEDATRPR